MTDAHAGNADSARVAGLDLLRGLAALSVALPHFLAYRGLFPDTAETVSALAVEVFFVLSGYVLAPQILFCLGTGRPRHLGVFLARRWMRTIPPYLVALLLISILSRQIGGADFLRYLCYAQNLFRQSNTTDYFAIAWSLSVEEWFYISFPSLLLAAACLFGRRDKRFAVVFGLGFCLAIIVARTLFGDLGEWGAAVRRVVIFRLDSIGYGFLLYLAVERAGSARLSRAPGWAIALILVLATVVAYLILDRITETGNPAAELLFPFAAAIFGGAAIVCAVRAEGTIQRLPALAWLGRYLGRVSYSTYLFHVILIELIGATLPRAGTVTQLTLFVTVLFGFTTLFYIYFERPILAARPHYRSLRPPALETLSAVAPADRQ
jgi:peptidoglycan/LPS O-acetylase OafA/YrhL